ILAAWTFSFGGDGIRADQIAVSLDDRFAALRAACVLPGANTAGQIAGVDEMQSFLGADFRGADQILRRGIVRLGHLVIFVESRHVPGNVAADGSEESGRRAQVVST